MYVQYGEYQHPADEVNLVNYEVIPRYSERRRRVSFRFRVHVMGEILVTDGLTTAAQVQSDLDTKINALVNAYAENDKYWGLYHDDGTVTRHRLNNADAAALTPVQVSYRSWPRGKPEEYATQRTFHIILEQEVKSAESQILAYSESVVFDGDTGPYYRWYQLPNGLATYQLVHGNTIQVIRQFGRCVMFEAWPDAYIGAPLLGVPFIQKPRTRKGYIKPTFTGRQWINYGIHWHYEFHVPEPSAVRPNTPLFSGV